MRTTRERQAGDLELEEEEGARVIGSLHRGIRRTGGVQLWSAPENKGGEREGEKEGLAKRDMEEELTWHRCGAHEARGGSAGGGDAAEHSI